jgi:Trypsin
LFFNIGTDTFACSASLIKRGVVVTAAHCVANFGQSQLYSDWQSVPGYRNGVAPFGVWSVRGVLLLTSYYNGTDPCAVADVVCLDDVAVLVLNTSAAGAYPGTATGYYGYGWDGFGFTGSWLGQVMRTRYPVCLDNGLYMEVNNSYGYISSSLAYNIIGSLMCGGSKGNGGIDYRNAKPMPLPSVPGPAPSETLPPRPFPGLMPGHRGSAPGSTGTGEENPWVLVPPER